MRGAVAQGQPFFLYYASHLPHVPLYASDDFLGHSTGGLYREHGVAELDASVGALLHEIQELRHRRQEGSVVFASDNGPSLLGDRPAPSRQGSQDSGSNSTLPPGRAGSTFEGGMRVPHALYFSGKVGFEFFGARHNRKAGLVTEAIRVPGSDQIQLLSKVVECIPEAMDNVSCDEGYIGRNRLDAGKIVDHLASLRIALGRDFIGLGAKKGAERVPEVVDMFVGPFNFEADKGEPFVCRHGMLS